MTRRSVSAFGLSVVLLITAVAFGVARGQARVAGQMVLCLGGAAVTVSVDRDGQPVKTVHVCPDCALASLAALDLPRMALLRPDLSRGTPLRPLAGGGVESIWRPAPMARAPPAFPV